MPGLTNYRLAYRPLMAGTAVSNPFINRFGSIGLILTSNGIDRLVLSCYHVLGREGGAVAMEGEPIFQPRVQDQAQAIGNLRLALSSQADDYAVAEIPAGIPCSPEIYGLGRVANSINPQVGQFVLKSGVGTGVTQGRVVSVQGDRVTIEALATFPRSYELTAASDSGAVWVTSDTHAPIALHQRGTPQGAKEISVGLGIQRILNTLGMRPMLPGDV